MSGRADPCMEGGGAGYFAPSSKKGGAYLSSTSGWPTALGPVTRSTTMPFSVHKHNRPRAIKQGFDSDDGTFCAAHVVRVTPVTYLCSILFDLMR